MAGKRTRRRRGHPKGKAYGFHGLRPAAKSGSSSQSNSSQSAPSEPSSPSNTTSD
jgi:hypothetical protein